MADRLRSIAFTLFTIATGFASSDTNDRDELARRRSLPGWRKLTIASAIRYSRRA